MSCSHDKNDGGYECSLVRGKNDYMIIERKVEGQDQLYDRWPECMD